MCPCTRSVCACVCVRGRVGVRISSNGLLYVNGFNPYVSKIEEMFGLKEFASAIRFVIF